MVYNEALEWMYSLTNYERRALTNYSPETLNLERMRALLASLGNPHLRFRSVHVAGTKGKGSTSAMIASALQKNGLKTGLYTSPHLHSFRERARIDGRMIDQIAVADLAAKVKAAAEQIPAEALGEVTTFEAITALSFLHFANENVECAVVEVGLGGRLDATNVVTPGVSVITSISLDHVSILGNTLALIAAEKAGIIKPGVPVVAQSQLPEASAVIDRIAHERNAPISWLGRHWRWTTLDEAASRGVRPDLPPLASPLAGQQFQVTQVAKIRSKQEPFLSDLEGWYEIPLLGKHQLENATTTVVTMQVLREHGFVVSARAVHEGLKTVSWPGRFEVLRGEPPLVLDGAHNVDSMNKLAVALAENFPGRRWAIIFGCLSGHDAEGMLRSLKGRAARIILVKTDNPRAVPTDQLMQMAQTLYVRASVADSVRDAVNAIANASEPVCATGSLSVCAEAREAWVEHGGKWVDKD